jgi:hypothetical protein
MSKEKLIWLGVGIVVGIVFAPQVSKIPFINKIPTL